MPQETRTRNRQPFLDALHSEILAGSENLTAWISRLQKKGEIESLFGLEAWLKGIRAFFSLDNLPLTDSEKSQVLARSFAPEIAVVRTAFQVCEKFGCAVLKPETEGTIEFEEFVETQMRRHRILDFNASRIAEQLTPVDSIARLLDFLNDIRVTVDALGSRDDAGCQLFLSLGRLYQRELKSCRYVDMLMTQRFRIQYDYVENKALSAALRRVPKESRKDTTLTLLFLFRFLKYLKLISADLKRDRPLKHHLVLFSLIYEEMNSLSEFIRARFLRERKPGNALQNTAELLSYSLRVEAKRVLERELITVSRERDPGPVYIRIENSHGLLRNCCQSSITALVQSIEPSFDPATIFPSRSGELIAAEKLRQDLWNLRSCLKNVLDNREELNPTGIIERVIGFKESSLQSLMYRDWAEFEAFSDALAVTGNFVELRTQIRKFVDFLETLIQEVSKRSVFQEQFR